MGFIDKYPYTDFHELNLDWILAKMRQLGIEMDQFKALNTITFSGTWDITHQYPAWTVVNDNNLGYISIRPVPAGILISNTDYWVSIVDYSAELAGIHSDIADLQNDIAGIYEDLSDGKWVFFGDSYENFGGWYNKVIAKLGLTDNVNAFYAGASGHGFTVTGMEWINDFNTFCTGRSDLDKFKHVVIVGGLNDSVPAVLSSDGATLRAAIDAFMSNMKTKMPNATAYVGYVGSGLADSVNLANRTAENRELAIYYYHDEVTKNGQKVLLNTEYTMYSYTFFESDGIHPNSFAGDIMATNIAEAILNGSCHVYGFSKDASNLTFMSGDLKAYGGVDCVVDNGVSRSWLNVIFNGSTTASFTINSTPYDLGEIPSKVFIRNSKEIPATVIRSDNSTADVMGVYIQIKNRHLIIRSGEMATRNAYKTLTFNVGNRFDLGNVCFTEDTLETM